MTDIIAQLQDVGAVGIVVGEVGEAIWEDVDRVAAVRVGVHRAGPLPLTGLDGYDILLTAEPDAARPWVAVPDIECAVARLRMIVAAQPVAAAALAQLLRTSLSLDFATALLIESFAYSTLLASAGFRRWLADRARRPTRADARPRVRLERHVGQLEIVLDRPRGRNAIDAAMRDALCEALDFAALDPDRAPIMLRGEGAVFSIGGDLAEFGQAEDPAAAHLIRMARSPARSLHAVAARTTARLHGPCIGAGIELPAAAGRIIAHPRTSFRLPELTMGLIPGAGGTATIPRRIGRHRACWLAMSGQTIGVEVARTWRLIDAVEG